MYMYRYEYYAYHILYIIIYLYMYIDIYGIWYKTSSTFLLLHGFQKFHLCNYQIY